MATVRWNSLVIVSSTIFVGCCSYYIYKWWRKRENKSIDEGFVDISRLEENPVKKILVLGVSNAGKSTIMSHITSDKRDSSKINATEGFSVCNLNHHDVTHNIWEIGGGDDVRQYWRNFVQDTDVLVFVVDSSDLQRLSVAVREFHLLLADERLNWVPIIILAHKQDLPSALEPSKVADALDVKSVNQNRHPITVLGTQLPPSAQLTHTSVREFDQVLKKLLKD